MSAFLCAVFPWALNRRGLDRERLHLRRERMERVYLRIEHNRIGVLPFGSHCGAWPCPADKSGDAASGQVQEFSAAVPARVPILAIIVGVRKTQKPRDFHSILSLCSSLLIMHQASKLLEGPKFRCPEVR